ncbi:unnamed protein product [Euphydryas editha]|uniref:Gag-like protein n=1 Tax=Euphydryas editha TaxID=104508 RepID=A0AAU9TK90_EUPED|nr:unnamed protein product [Euphydryas editha]
MMNEVGKVVFRRYVFSHRVVNISTDTTFTGVPDSDLSVKREEHSRLFLENNDRTKFLQEQLTKCSAAINVHQRSATPFEARLHSVVVNSRDEEETGNQVLGRVRKMIDVKEGWVKVERVQKARDQKVIMGFGTAEERKKSTEKLVTNRPKTDLQRVKAQDQSPVGQCTRCLAYGLGRKYCKDPADLRVCSHSSGSHLKSKCADWLAGSSPSCRKYRKARLELSRKNY